MTKKLDQQDTPINALLNLMARLRDPKGGCPWDLEQDFASVAPHTIEEAYEVADAIGREDFEELKSELGDLLFQVVFHAQLGAERGLFSLDDVAQSVTEKMVARHPHVFGVGETFNRADHHAAWEAIKANERKSKGTVGVMDDVPIALPGMSRALKIQKRAATVGFDWSNISDVADKVDEELSELKSAINADGPAEIEGELGDLLFAVINLARHKGVDPEAALRKTNEKFIRRFRHIEATLAANNEDIKHAGLNRMEELWTNAKALEDC